MAENVLSINNLKTQFSTQDGTVYAVDGLSFDVVAGQIVGLVGESGCGKSTVAMSIMRLLPRQGQIVDGQIRVGGRDLVPLTEPQMQKVRGNDIAMIFQDALTTLNPTMKVGRHLIQPLQIHRKMDERAARAYAIELLDHVGIPDPAARMETYPHELSGGMRQRVMIAMALSCDPKLLIADEPTTALDVTIQRQIMDLILRLRDETGAGIVLITHDVGVVAEVCDRVVVMYAGKEVESGPTEEIFMRPRHPYTIGLLNSSLGLNDDRTQPLQAIPGLPPSLVHLPEGCRFAPRCRHATDQCRQMPPLEMVRADHAAACWHKEEVYAEFTQ
ncbi:MAG: peptide ABC transporter ATP-binding protein [Anaerolineaceae bacterium]|nr:peptide ABC transporter ATP-binding protein [Anaerolineaceae bacterium]